VVLSKHGISDGICCHCSQLIICLKEGHFRFTSVVALLRVEVVGKVVHMCIVFLVDFVGSMVSELHLSVSTLLLSHMWAFSFFSKNK
jgi:hypothetical protein